MDHVSLRREFVQRARETRRTAQVAHHRNTRPIPGKATAVIVVERDVTPSAPHRKQSRFRASHGQRLAKPRDRVGRSAMGRVKSGDDMHGTQRANIQMGSRVGVLRRVLPRFAKPRSVAAGGAKAFAISSGSAVRKSRRSQWKPNA